jgi:hypothetical protein
MVESDGVIPHGVVDELGELFNLFTEVAEVDVPLALLSRQKKNE